MGYRRIVSYSRFGGVFNCKIVKDCWNRPVILFKNEWNPINLLNNANLTLNKVAPASSGKLEHNIYKLLRIIKFIFKLLRKTWIQTAKQ